MSGLGSWTPYSYRDEPLADAWAFAETRSNLDWALTLNTREYVNEEEWRVQSFMI